MRLSEVLSKEPTEEYKQVEGFLINKQCKLGQQIKIDVGTIALNYFCVNCKDMRTFHSVGQLICVCINERMISVDCVLRCTCGETVQIWFLIESKNDINGQVPNIRIIKKSEQTNNVYHENYGDFSNLLNKADQAYWNGFGAGSIVYLRKIYEKITMQIAQANNMEYDSYENGNPKNFSKLLKEVDEKYHIIPSDFLENRAKLFRELSGVVHGDYDDAIGLSEYKALKRLIIGILDNIRNREEISVAVSELGWNIDRGEDGE